VVWSELCHCTIWQLLWVEQPQKLSLVLSKADEAELNNATDHLIPLFCVINLCGANHIVFSWVIACLKFRRVNIFFFANCLLRDYLGGILGAAMVIPSICCQFGRCANFPRQTARPWLKALKATEVWGGLSSRTTTSVTVALRHLQPGPACWSWGI